MQSKKRTLVVVAFSLFSTALTAQEIAVPPSLSPVTSYVSFTYDNDFFNATDRYYTAGLRLELSAPFVQKSPLSKLLIPLQQSPSRQYIIALQQDCFTPPGIRRDTIQKGERPFGAVAFLSHSLITLQPQQHKKLLTQFDIGIIGPCAKCKEEQEFLHRLLDNLAPLGWQFQLSTDIIINYNLQVEKGLWLKKGIEIVGYTGLRAGTLYDDVSAGMLVRMGRMKPYFKNDQQVNGKKFQLYGFVNGKVKAVVYNATLQGGLFNKNDIYTLKANEITRAVWVGSVGIVLVYNKLDIEYTRVFITPESKGGLHHGWGHVNIKVDF